MEEENFEQPILELEKRIEELSGFTGDEAKERELQRLRKKLDVVRAEIYSNLTPWQKTLVARHPRRPYTRDYIGHLFVDFVEIHGDRKFADDPAIVGGLAFYRGIPVAVVGHQKGRDTKEKIFRNFGMPKPEGYRKAIRIMKIAEKFGRPIFTFIDTPGAYPGIGAEERGQAEAIAYNLREMARLKVPLIITVTGEGGSGGALALGVGDVINMLEFAIYSVISPEGCAAILYRDQTKAKVAAKSMKITSQDLRELGVIDEIIPEGPGGAHSDLRRMADTLDQYFIRQLRELIDMDPEERIRKRYEKFRRMGKISEWGSFL
ncbi:MAG: acetyl-CoA carboxylase carboxyltransferase subunit alpha [Acidobacteriota bacterium]